MEKQIKLGNSGACLSTCNKYRYALWRIWDDSLPQVMFIMLNPSTADATQDDPTIRRCIAFAKSWGYGGILIGNLFAYRSTNPKNLLTCDDPVGPCNLEYLQKLSQRADKIILAYGNYQIVNRLRRADYKPFEGLTNLYYLELSKDRVPKHPLYLQGNLKPAKVNDWANLRFIF